MGGNTHNAQENIQSRIQKTQSRSARRQPTMPLVQESPSHRSRSCTALRPSRRRHTHSPQLQTMQRTKRSHLLSTKESPCPAPTQRSPRTPKRQQNAKTKNNGKFFEKRKNQAPVPFFALIWNKPNQFRWFQFGCV